nr:unnamed protein product [Digitaria exilis]
MANFGEGRPPLGESNLLPAGQEIRFGSLRFQTCGDDYHMRILQEDPSDRPGPHHQPPATPRAADIGDPHPTREGDILWSGSQERAAPFLPGPMAAPRATTAHSYPYGLRNSADAYASFIRTTMSANGNQPGCHPASEQDFAGPSPGDPRAESDDGYAFMRGHPGWDYSGLRDPEAFMAFQTAADYCFGYSDDEYDPTRECFVINDGQLSEGSTSNDDRGGDDQGDNDGIDPIGAQPPDPTSGIRATCHELLAPTTWEVGDNDGIDPIGAQPPDPSDHSPSEDERHPRHLPRVARPHDLGSGDVSPPARSDHELSKQGHEHGTDARHAGRAKMTISPPRTSQKLIAAAALLRAMPEAATPEGRKLHLEAQKLVETAARQQAESSASRIRRSAASKGERGGESSVRSPRPNGRARAQSRSDSCRDSAQRHANEPRTPEARTLPARVPARSRLRDTRGAEEDQHVGGPQHDEPPGEVEEGGGDEHGAAAELVGDGAREGGDDGGADERRGHHEALHRGLGLQVELALDVQDGAGDGGVVPTLKKVADGGRDGHPNRALHAFLPSFLPSFLPLSLPLSLSLCASTRLLGLQCELASPLIDRSICFC